MIQDIRPKWLDKIESKLTDSEVSYVLNVRADMGSEMKKQAFKVYKKCMCLSLIHISEPTRPY